MGEATHFVEIYEALELQDFPIDLQDLNISVVSKVPTEKVKWCPPRNHSTGEVLPCCRISREHFKVGDFQLVDLQDSAPMVFHMKPRIGGDGREFARVHCGVKVKRKITFYMLNVNFMMFLITICTLGTFCLHPIDI